MTEKIATQEHRERVLAKIDTDLPPRRVADELRVRDIRAALSGERIEIEDAPCKNEGFTVVGTYGECLRCGADQGEACRK